MNRFKAVSTLVGPSDYVIWQAKYRGRLVHCYFRLDSGRRVVTFAMFDKSVFNDNKTCLKTHVFHI